MYTKCQREGLDGRLNEIFVTVTKKVQGYYCNAAICRIAASFRRTLGLRKPICISPPGLSRMQHLREFLAATLHNL